MTEFMCQSVCVYACICESAYKSKNNNKKQKQTNGNVKGVTCIKRCWLRSEREKRGGVKKKEKFSKD